MGGVARTLQDREDHACSGGGRGGADGGQRLHAERGNHSAASGQKRKTSSPCSSRAVVPLLSLWVPGLGVDTPALAPRPASPLPTRVPSASTHASCAGGGASVSALRSARSLPLKTKTGPHTDCYERRGWASLGAAKYVSRMDTTWFLFSGRHALSRSSRRPPSRQAKLRGPRSGHGHASPRARAPVR